MHELLKTWRNAATYTLIARRLWAVADSKTPLGELADALLHLAETDERKAREAFMVAFWEDVEAERDTIVNT